MTSRQSSSPAPDRALQGRTALVTGASSGIGRAIALGLARQGAGLCLVGRDRGRLESAANEAGAPALFYQVDLARDGEIERLVRDVAKGPGGIDILVMSHGLFSAGTSESVPVSELDALYRTNVRAAYLLAQSFLPSLTDRQGQIVFVNSSVVAGARGGVGQYAASKLALKGLADSLRDEVNPRGIRVLSVFPGRTATPMQEAIFESEGRSWEPERLLQPEDVAEMVIAALLVPRTAEVTEIHIRPMNKV